MARPIILDTPTPDEQAPKFPVTVIPLPENRQPQWRNNEGQTVVSYPNINFNDHRPDTNPWQNYHTITETLLFAWNNKSGNIRLGDRDFPIPAPLLFGVVCVLFHYGFKRIFPKRR